MLLFDLEPKEAVVVSIRTDTIRDVFSHWRKYHPRAFPRLHSELKEWKRVADRLKDGYSLAQLCRAIDGIHNSPFHRGENDRNRAYMSLELCMRDASRVEQFMAVMDEHESHKPLLTEKTQRTLRAGHQWLQGSSGEVRKLEGPTDGND
jgi:hypothetical protein